MRISFVDLSVLGPDDSRAQALEDTLTSVAHAEGIGATRYWFTEHHSASGFASTSPPVLIAAASRVTSTIRLGSGAILLNQHSPYLVAETFATLEQLAPGRIDLGLGRATAGRVVDLALRRDRRATESVDFAEQVEEVVAFGRDGFAVGHPFAQIDRPAPAIARPELWVLGSSGATAGIAADLGLGYVMAAFINPDGAAPALEHYRSRFSPATDGFRAPHAAVSVNIVVAETDSDARRLAWSHKAGLAMLQAGVGSRRMPTVDEARSILTDGQKDSPTTIIDGRWPTVIAGSIRTVAAQLELIRDVTGATEIIAQDQIPELSPRLRSHELLAEAGAQLHRL